MAHRHNASLLRQPQATLIQRRRKTQLRGQALALALASAVRAASAARVAVSKANMGCKCNLARRITLYGMSKLAAVIAGVT